MIEFENPFYLISLALLLPLIIFVHFFSLKHAKRKAMKFANFEAIEKVIGTPILSKNLTILYLRILVVLLFVLALSGMKFTYYGVSSNRTFVLAIDASLSMNASDIKPTRLEAAKSSAIKFVEKLPLNSEAAVVSFSGISLIEQPLTSDKEKLKAAIKNIKVKEIGGTDLLSALITSANLLKASNKTGAIVLLTDGQFNTKALEDVLIYLHNIPVYALGIGTKEGGKFLGNVTSKLEEKALEAIANYTNGKYFKVSTKEEIENAYSQIIELKKEKKETNLSFVFLIISICLLLTEWILSSTKFRTLP